MWIRIDFITLLDAIEIADKFGERIRPNVQSDAEVRDFLMSEGLTILDIMSPFEDGACPRKVALLSHGLYQGVYRYDLDEEAAYRWVKHVPSKIPPQLSPHGEDMFDVAISYSTEDYDEYVAPIVEEISRAGGSVFLIDISDFDGNDLWKIRYREGIFHSRFLVPVISEAYLGRQGTRDEYTDIRRITLEHRGTENFHTLLPLVTANCSLNDLEERWSASSVSEEDYSLIKHSFALPRDWSPSRLSEFIVSLSRGSHQLAKNGHLFDVNHLRLLSPYVTYAREYSLSSTLAKDVDPSRRTSLRLAIRHSLWNDRNYDCSLLINGRFMFMGIGDEYIAPVIEGRANAEYAQIYDDFIGKVTQFYAAT